MAEKQKKYDREYKIQAVKLSTADNASWDPHSRACPS